MNYRFVARLLLATALSWSAFCAHAGEDVASRIEKDVWIPFIAAASAFDAEAFLAVQSKDVVRLSVDDNEVYGLDRYGKEVREGFARAKTRGIRRRSEMRFLSRVHSGDLAYQTGYFHSRSILPGGEERVRYSRFEVVLRRENGTWKILLDKDTAQGGAITESMYREAQPMIHATTGTDAPSDGK